MHEQVLMKYYIKYLKDIGDFYGTTEAIKMKFGELLRKL